MNEFKFKQPLIIANIALLLKSMTKLLAASKQLSIDLSTVSNIDSSGVALLLELKAVAHHQHCQLNFTNTPEVVKKFCQLYQVNL